jgi:chaperonin GroEL
LKQGVTVPKPAVLFADQVTGALKRGFDQMAELLAITLGPTQGNILNELTDGAPELLTDSATIARRVLALPGQASNVGAMLVRSLAWRVNSRAGDGAATAAVLAQAILREATRYTQAGGNAMLVKQGIEQATQVALETLAAQAQPVKDEEELTRLAETLTAEPGLSLILGEMFDVLGETAHIVIEDYVAPYLERVYYDGGRWGARLQSNYFITDQPGHRAVQTDCQVLIYAGRLNTLPEVQPILELLARHKKKQLLLVAYEVTGEALGALVLNHQKDIIKSIVVGSRRPANRRAEDLADLGLITGAKVIGGEWGETLANLSLADLGSVRRAEAGGDHLVVSGGGGDPALRRDHLQELQAQLARMPETDDDRDDLIVRVARLAGGIGVLKIGTYSKLERKALHQKAEKAIRSLRLALAEGVVPGGGAAYLRAIPAVERLQARLSGDEQHGARILARALEEPFLRIVRNRGLKEPAVAIAEIRRCGPDYVYDALADCYGPYPQVGLFDPVGVLRIALETAASGAAMALTTGVLILHRKPEEMLEP